MFFVFLFFFVLFCFLFGFVFCFRFVLFFVFFVLFFVFCFVVFCFLFLFCFAFCFVLFCFLFCFVFVLFVCLFVCLFVYSFLGCVYHRKLLLVVRAIVMDSSHFFLHRSKHWHTKRKKVFADRKKLQQTNLNDQKYATTIQNEPMSIPWGYNN